VYENDTFVYRGPAAQPELQADPFKPRGEIIGAYCIAKTHDGDFLTEVMDRAAIEQIRSASTAWTKGAVGKKGPWEDYFSEMCRKSVIKRARKTWPYTDRSGRMALAVDLANQAEGGYTFEGQTINATATTGDPGPVTLEDRRLEDHLAALEQYQDAVDAVKAAIADENWQRMTAHWNTIPQVAQIELWLAPTKGGKAFTTAERKAIKERKIATPQLQRDRDTGEVLPAELQ
jgi:recombination protein RecT